MSIFFFKEMARIKEDILALGALTEDSLHRATTAVIQRDIEIARQLPERDKLIDAKEVEIEEELLKILALHQPVAVDLRFLVAMLKINNDLERIGDLAVNIAKRALTLAEKPHILVPVDFTVISRDVEIMLRKSIDSLVNIDVQLAQDVCRSDDSIDIMKTDIDRTIKAKLADEGAPEGIDVLVSLFRVARDLERIADHATNIAEDVIYMTDGQIIRHNANGTISH